MSNKFDSIFSTFKLICDTREQKNTHVLQKFIDLKIPIIYDTLDFADYSCICCDYDFRNEVVIERKNSIDEFCTNMTRKRVQFENELNKAYEANAKFQLVIEDEYINILNEFYRSKTNKNSIIATLNSYKFRYGIDYIFLSKNATSDYIYNYFKYYIREYLKLNQII